jgi:hypothetical protein
MVIAVPYEHRNAKLLHYACDSFCIMAMSVNGVIPLNMNRFRHIYFINVGAVVLVLFSSCMKHY